MKFRSTQLADLYTWVDERSGIKSILQKFLEEPIRGGARWAYIFGSILLFLFTIQVVTGIVLSLYYVPSADHAHASVAYIQKAVPGGALLRGLHHYSASAMVIFAVIHLAQTFIYGAYKKKRELVWLAGGVMLLLILGFAFTGYLLPWDQAAYFGTKVGASIAGEVPLVGALQQKIMLGGNELSTATLSRFFTAHVFLLPLALTAFIGLHLFFFRRAQPAGPFHSNDDHKTEKFYPKQIFKDALAALCVLIVLIWIVQMNPAELGPPADPTSDYLARPPWYFLPLFQLLKYFPGHFTIIPTVILPAVIFGLIFLLPFFDRSETRHPRQRPIAMATLSILMIGAIGLILLSKYEDRKNPEFKAKLIEQDEDAREFLKAPFEPQQIGLGTVPSPTPAVAVTNAEPPAIFVESCAECHGNHGEGGTDDEPSLIGIVEKKNRTKEDLLKIMNNARSYGLKKPMPRAFPELTEADKTAITEWIVGLKTK